VYGTLADVEFLSDLRIGYVESHQIQTAYPILQIYVTGPKNGFRQIIEILPAAMAAIAKIRLLLGSSARFFAILGLAVGARQPHQASAIP
jgi:hypothetical protein